MQCMPFRLGHSVELYAPAVYAEVRRCDAIVVGA
jgi:hypothetical protein